MEILDGFNSLPLIGGVPLLGQVLILVMASSALFFAGGYLWSEFEGYNRPLEILGGAIAGVGALVGSATLVFFTIGGISAAGEAASNALEREVVPASRILIDPDWDRERIVVACDSTPDRGEIELLGKRTPTSFQVRAYRMRAGGPGSDLTRPAWFSLSQREIWRSGPPPSFEFGAIRADGRWHSRRVQGTVSFTRGDYWLLDAALGVRGKTGAKTLTNPRFLEERCDDIPFAF